MLMKCLGGPAEAGGPTLAAFEGAGANAKGETTGLCEAERDDAEADAAGRGRATWGGRGAVQ